MVARSRTAALKRKFPVSTRSVKAAPICAAPAQPEVQMKKVILLRAMYQEARQEISRRQLCGAFKILHRSLCLQVVRDCTRWSLIRRQVVDHRSAWVKDIQEQKAAEQAAIEEQEEQNFGAVKSILMDLQLYGTTELDIEKTRKALQGVIARHREEGMTCEKLHELCKSLLSRQRELENSMNLSQGMVNILVDMLQEEIERMQRAMRIASASSRIKKELAMRAAEAKSSRPRISVGTPITNLHGTLSTDTLFEKKHLFDSVPPTPSTAAPSDSLSSFASPSSSAGFSRFASEVPDEPFEVTMSCYARPPCQAKGTEKSPLLQRCLRVSTHIDNVVDENDDIAQSGLQEASRLSPHPPQSREEGLSVSPLSQRQLTLSTQVEGVQVASTDLVQSSAILNGTKSIGHHSDNEDEQDASVSGSHGIEKTADESNLLPLLQRSEHVKSHLSGDMHRSLEPRSPVHGAAAASDSTLPTICNSEHLDSEDCQGASEEAASDDEEEQSSPPASQRRRFSLPDKHFMEQRGWLPVLPSSTVSGPGLAKWRPDSPQTPGGWPTLPKRQVKMSRLPRLSAALDRYTASRQRRKSY